MQITIRFPERIGEPSDLAAQLTAFLSHVTAGEQIRISAKNTRVIDVAIVVATITGGATVISALIQAVAAIASSHSSPHAKVAGSMGGEMEFRTKLDPDAADKLAADLMRFQDPRIEVL